MSWEVGFARMAEAEPHSSDAGTRVRILPLRGWQRELGGPIDASHLARLEAIFFAASNVRHFADEPARHAFRERWLGRYLAHYSADFFLAIDDAAGIVGYLAGCLDDPARLPLFTDIGYFAENSDITRRYPAHLHVNLDADWRNRGIGARLIDAFCAHAAAAKAPGVHVVTGSATRNVRFYARCGFAPLRTVVWNGSRIVILGRALAGDAHP